ncbi:MAG TPA: methionine--tRNA ligase [Acidimicrobiia bacterium]|jgi:methionyl-tRNA synthetase|nr:methionine--tRNA ligase [Acidimicrobiia bacterium]
MSRFYVTTPIYYVNDVPHIGHAYTTVAGDVLTRWRRLWGDEVFYLTGTDEHGLKVQRAAEARGLTPKELVDETAKHFRDTWDSLDIAYDDFIRTTEPRHYTAVAQFLQKIYDAGDIELGTYEGLYCVSCEAYYGEDELVDGCCPIHMRPVEHVVEENYFFKLSRYEDRLLDYYAEHPEAVQPESRRNEVLGFIRGGLQDFSVSRTSISWGVPLPWDTNHVAYVWADALFNYCTAVGYGTDDERFAYWWPVDYHVIGKDILRFHAVYWPAMLMSAGIEPPKCVFAHGWLLVGGEKMSKTRLNQIAPADLVEDFGVDGFRYHFMADQRFGPDGDFSYEAMLQRYNADLANNFGNTANRVLNMAVNYCGGVVPEKRADALAPAARAAFDGLGDAMTRLDFASGFGAVWELIRATNAYIEDRAPWALHKAGDADAVAEVLGDCLEALRIVALLASPVIPRAAGELWRRLGLEGRPEDARLPEAAAWGLLPAGAKLEKGDPLFPRKDVG